MHVSCYLRHPSTPLQCKAMQCSWLYSSIPYLCSDPWKHFTVIDYLFDTTTVLADTIWTLHVCVLKGVPVAIIEATILVAAMCAMKCAGRSLDIVGRIEKLSTGLSGETPSSFLLLSLWFKPQCALSVAVIWTVSQVLLLTVNLRTCTRANVWTKPCPVHTAYYTPVLI